MKVLDEIGNTPLFQLSAVVHSGKNVTVFAKALILEGIRTGKLRKDKTIIDATSGSTGIAYAMTGAALGYQVTLCMPSNVSIRMKSTGRPII